MPTSSGRPTSSTRLQSLTSAQPKPLLDLNKNRRLPPVQQKVSSSASTEMEVAQSGAAQSIHTSQLTELIIPKPPSEARTSRHEASQRLHHHHHHQLSAPTSAPYKPPKSYSARATRSRQFDPDGKLYSQYNVESKIRCIPEHEPITERVAEPITERLAEPPKALVTKAPHPPFSKRRDSSEKLASPLSTDTSATPHLLRRSSSRQHDVRSTRQQHADVTLDSIKDSFYSQRITLESLSSNEAKMMS